MSRKPNVVVCGIPMFAGVLGKGRTVLGPLTDSERIATIGPSDAKKLLAAAVSPRARLVRGSEVKVCDDQFLVRRGDDGGYEVHRRAPGEFRGARRRRR